MEAGVPVIHALRGWVAKQGEVLNLLNLSVAVSFTKWPLFECKFPMRIIFRCGGQISRSRVGSQIWT
jgi:hypothetical protein